MVGDKIMVWSHSLNQSWQYIVGRLGLACNKANCTCEIELLLLLGSMCSWFILFYLQSDTSNRHKQYANASRYGNMALCFSMAAIVWGFVGIIVSIGVISQFFPGFRFPCICFSSKCAVYECGMNVENAWFCHIYHCWMCLIHKFHQYGFSWPHVHTSILIWATLRVVTRKTT